MAEPSDCKDLDDISFQFSEISMRPGLLIALSGLPLFIANFAGYCEQHIVPITDEAIIAKQVACNRIRIFLISFCMVITSTLQLDFHILHLCNIVS